MSPHFNLNTVLSLKAKRVLPPLPPTMEIVAQESKNSLMGEALRDITVTGPRHAIC